ncbi:MAG: InlB B-repeat-containing protein [Anaerolineaceae bacterium]|jgi:uncharacterized repeat protein (TIGR02543 family)|nr:InlB B-repeat-containing protein [Anaerolineaceae bacterium]
MLKTRKNYLILLLILTLIFFPFGKVNAAQTTNLNTTVKSEELIAETLLDTLEISDFPYTIYLPLVQSLGTNVKLTISQSENYNILVEPNGPYEIGDLVTLTATAKPGYLFTGWTGDLSGTDNPITLTMDGNKTVNARVELNELSLTINQTTGGTITANPTGPYHYDDVVELFAEAEPGYFFTGWMEDMNGTENPTTLTLNGNKSVSANFALQVDSLTINQTTGGTITADPSGPYHYGDVVTLIAEAKPGYSFTGWMGDLSGTENPTTLTLNGNKSVSANFDLNVMFLTINQTTGGTIVADPVGPYHYGDIVTLTISTASGYVFSGWIGDAVGTTNPFTVVMDKNKTISASMEKEMEGTYYVSSSGNDDNPGTFTQPWRSIQKAANVLVAGDTVLIRAGTYNERIIPNNSGSPGNYITYAAYPNEKVVLDGNGINFSKSEEGLIHVKNKNYIKLQDLTIQNSTDMGIYVVGTYNPRILTSNIILSNLEVLNSNNEAIKVMFGDHILIENSYTKESVSSGIGVWNSSNVIVDNNTVVNARNLPMPYGHEECITISNVSNFEVKNNEVYFENFNNYLGAAGIDIKNSSFDGSVHHNYVHSFYQDGAIYLDAWEAGLNGTQSLHNIDVYANRTERAGGVSIGSERGGIVENINIYNNIIIDSACSGIFLHRSGASAGGDGLRKNINIYNNTIFRSIGNGGAGIYIATANIENIVIKNNIVDFGPKWVGQITLAFPSAINQITVDRNLTWGRTECSMEYPDCVELDNGTIRADPMFVNRSLLDLRLQENSPAINTGLTIPIVDMDFNGKLRPLGFAYDLGVYEVK